MIDIHDFHNFHDFHSQVSLIGQYVIVKMWMCRLGCYVRYLVKADKYMFYRLHVPDKKGSNRQYTALYAQFTWSRYDWWFTQKVYLEIGIANSENCIIYYHQGKRRRRVPEIISSYLSANEQNSIDYLLLRILWTRWRPFPSGVIVISSNRNYIKHVHSRCDDKREWRQTQEKVSFEDYNQICTVWLTYRQTIKRGKFCITLFLCVICLTWYYPT